MLLFLDKKYPWYWLNDACNLIYMYLCNECLSPMKYDDEVFQWQVAGILTVFWLATNIIDIVLNMVLNTCNTSIVRQQYLCHIVKMLNDFQSFKVATMTWLTVTEYMCHRWPWICFVCNNANLVHDFSADFKHM